MSDDLKKKMKDKIPDDPSKTMGLLPTRRPTPEGRPSSWQIIEPCMSTEEKSHLGVRDPFLTIFGCK